MRTFRWLVCFPVAWAASLAVFFLLAFTIFSSMTYGGSFPHWLLGPLPGVLRTAVPAVVFVVLGAVISPSRGRRVVFVFSGLSLLGSGGTFEFQHIGDDVPLAIIVWIGIILGSVAGLFAGLKIQAWRSRRVGSAVSPAIDPPKLA